MKTRCETIMNFVNYYCLLISSDDEEDLFLPTTSPWSIYRSYDTNNFKALFRFSKVDIITMHQLLNVDEYIILDNNYQIESINAFCIMLYRMANPSSLAITSNFFNRSTSILSRIFNYMVTLIYKKVKTKMTYDTFLINQEKIHLYSRCINSPTKRCWGFVDGNFHHICRPSGSNDIQRAFYNGSKKRHGINFQCVTTPNGMIAALSRPLSGTQGDATVVAESQLYNLLDKSFILPHNWR